MRYCTLFVLMLCAACGADASSEDSDQDEDDGTVDGDGASNNGCKDEDGDGFGMGCEAGADCNDKDDTVSVECTCTEVVEGCVCEVDTPPVECELPKDQVREDTILCKTGMRYCQDGKWTDCVGLASFQNSTDLR